MGLAGRAPPPAGLRAGARGRLGGLPRGARRLKSAPRQERTTPAARLFAWRPWGSGRRALPCARCGALAPVWVLENLLEVLCPACGRNVAVERLRALAADGGEEAVRGALEALGVDSAPGELPPAGGDLVERLLDAGLLRRDLRLVLELCPGEGWHAYGAAPLRDVILPAELRAALASRRLQGGVLSELLREQALARFAASVRSVGRESGLPALSGPTEVEAEAVAALPRRALEEFRAVPVRREGDALVVAVWDPLDPRVVADLESLAGRPVQAVLGEPALLEECLVRLGVGPRPRAPEVETGPPLPEAAVEDELTPSLSELLLEALEEGATEVLVEPRPEGASLRLRVGGELRKERCLPRSAPTALAEELGLRGGPRAAVGVLRCEVSGCRCGCVIGCSRRPSAQRWLSSWTRTTLRRNRGWAGWAWIWRSSRPSSRRSLAVGACSCSRRPRAASGWAPTAPSWRGRCALGAPFSRSKRRFCARSTERCRWRAPHPPPKPLPSRSPARTGWGCADRWSGSRCDWPSTRPLRGERSCWRCLRPAPPRPWGGWSSRAFPAPSSTRSSGRWWSAARSRASALTAAWRTKGVGWASAARRAENRGREGACPWLPSRAPRLRRCPHRGPPSPRASVRSRSAARCPGIRSPTSADRAGGGEEGGGPFAGGPLRPWLA
ncbi:MAG: type II/IV secretion system protein [Planctomycetota bacterium]|nr:MAG: type II/IV secretion system protein [Planctomycetota bacterium]